MIGPDMRAGGAEHGREHGAREAPRGQKLSGHAGTCASDVR